MARCRNDIMTLLYLFYNFDGLGNASQGIGGGLSMNWDAIQAFGTIYSAMATLFASLVALYLGLRKPKKDLSINAYFYEKSHVLDNLIQPDYLILASDLEDNQTDDRLLGLGVHNNCGDDVVLVGFIDRAHFNYSPKTLIKRVRQHKRKASSFPTAHGYLSINSRYGDMPYLFRSPVKILRGQQMLFCIDYDCLKRTPLDREKSNLFDLKKTAKHLCC